MSLKNINALTMQVSLITKCSMQEARKTVDLIMRVAVEMGYDELPNGAPCTRCDSFYVSPMAGGGRCCEICSQVQAN